MKQKLTEVEIYKRYLEIEKELDLFNKTIDGIYFWKIVRIELYLKLQFEDNVFSKRQKRDFLKIQIFKRITDIVKNSFFHSTFNGNQQVNTIFFENPRKIRQTDEKYLDPFTYYYIQRYEKENSDFEIVDLGYSGIHFDKADEKRKFADSFYYDIVYRIKNKLFKIEFSESEKSIVDKIENVIYEKFEIKLNIENLIKQKILDFRYQYAKFDKLFKIKKPKAIYLVCSYGKEGMIYVAQSNDIKVIEFQHGVMGKYQLGYSFPDNTKVPYFPDKLCLFGEFWDDITDLPKCQLEIEYIGFEYLTSKLVQYSVLKKKKQVLIISQPGNVRELIPTAILWAQSNPAYSFIYRLHPKEIGNTEKLYTDLKNVSKDLKNLEVDECKLDLYQQVSESEFVVGVYSAVLFESILLDTNLVILNSPGAEYVDYLVKKSFAIKVEPLSALNFKHLNKKVFSQEEKNYFYKIS